jgi:galactokinase
LDQCPALACGGVDLAIAGDIPHGAGLSSSASLEVAVLQALQSVGAVAALDGTRTAQLAQGAENDFVGVPCGIMDQLVVTRARQDHALLIDCRSLDARAIAMPAGLAVLIVDSGVKHAHVGGEYRQRRAQCKTAASAMQVEALRDVPMSTLESHRHALDAVTYRRARHVVTENARTLEAAQALERGDLRTLGTLMAASHASMRDDFEITVPEIDALVTVLQSAIGAEGGARMTGGGFGGCAVALLDENRTDHVMRAVETGCVRPDGQRMRALVCRASSGADAIAIDAPN